MAKPSAVTEIETIPYSVAACVHDVHAIGCFCVLHASVTLWVCVGVRGNICARVACRENRKDGGEGAKKCNSSLIKKKEGGVSDSANSVSVGIQITNKCPTLLNRPLAIIARPTRHFQNL